MSTAKIKSAKDSISDVDLNKREAIVAFATYNTPDRDKDIANQGMFKKSWQEFTDVLLFENHDKLRVPGKILKLWDDPNNAHAHIQLGRDTLGNDTLLRIQDGIMKNSSYLFYPLKYDPIKGGGMSVKEAFHKEVSLLTHWGAHPESRVTAVAKQASEVTIHDAIEKQLNSDEVIFLRNHVRTLNANLIDLVAFSVNLNESSDLYYWVNDMVASLSYSIQRFKDRLVWGQKEWNGEELSDRLSKLKSFANNSTASDECIQGILKEAGEIENILLIGTVESTLAATKKALKQPTEDSTGDTDTEIQLLNLNMLLNG